LEFESDRDVLVTPPTRSVDIIPDHARRSPFQGAEDEEFDEEKTSVGRNISLSALTTCHFLVQRTLHDFGVHFEEIVAQISSDVSLNVNVIHLIFLDRDVSVTENDLVVLLEKFFFERKDTLKSARIRRITVAFHRNRDYADYYTFLGR
jgi:hypothetical protein